MVRTLPSYSTQHEPAAIKHETPGHIQVPLGSAFYERTP